MNPRINDVGLEIDGGLRRLSRYGNESVLKVTDGPRGRTLHMGNPNKKRGSKSTRVVRQKTKREHQDEAAALFF